MAIECHFVRAAKDLASLHICTGLPKPSSLYKRSCAALNGDLCAIHASSEYSGESAHLRRQSLDNVINIKISCAGSKGSWEYALLHRLAWAFYTVSKYHVLVEMAIFATFMWSANDVVSLHQQPQEFCTTISALYQCVKKCSQCVVIKIPQ